MSYTAAQSGTLQDAVYAKVYCSEALRHIAVETVQLLDGIAITWEHGAQLYFKRAHGDAKLFGQSHDYIPLIAGWTGMVDA